jgi:hypothetical protein
MRISKIGDNAPINESVDRDKVISWITMNPALRLNKVGGKNQHGKFRSFNMSIVMIDTRTDRQRIIGMRDNLGSDEIQRGLSQFKNIGFDHDQVDIDPDDADDFMKDAEFYALCSAKEGPIVYGIAVSSMDDPRFQEVEDEDFGSDEELFGLSPEEMKKLWGD